MAWWTHILFLNGHTTSSLRRKEGIFTATYKNARPYVRKKFGNILYVIFTLFTYLYLAISIITFFFYDKVPAAFPFVIDTLSDPYLGALGISLVIRGIERRGNKHSPKGALFVPIWFCFFVAASLFLFFAPTAYLNDLYKVVVTNAFASIILRAGMMLR